MNREPLSKYQRFKVLNRDQFTCQYCGLSAPHVVLEIDHIRPLSNGGTDDFDNLVTACHTCNRGKRDMQSTINPLARDPYSEATLKRVRATRMLIENKEEYYVVREAKVQHAIKEMATALRNPRELPLHTAPTVRPWVEEYTLDNVLLAIERAGYTAHGRKGRELEVLLTVVPRILEVIEMDNTTGLAEHIAKLSEWSEVSHEASIKMLEKILDFGYVYWQDLISIATEEKPAAFWNIIHENVGWLDNGGEWEPVIFENLSDYPEWQNEE